MRAIASSRTAATLLAALGILGVLAVVAARRFDMPVLIGPGLLLFAAGIVAVGLYTIATRYTIERTRGSRRIIPFVGPAAVLIGFAVVLCGIAIGVAGAAYLLGAEDHLLEFLKSRPGYVLAPGGAALAAYGAARIFGARPWNQSLGSFLMSIPERFGGAILFLIGLAVLAVGAFELVAPTAFDDLLASFRTQFTHPIAESMLPGVTAARAASRARPSPRI